MKGVVNKNTAKKETFKSFAIDHCLTLKGSPLILKLKTEQVLNTDNQLINGAFDERLLDAVNIKKLQTVLNT